MKASLFILLLFVGSLGFSQSVKLYGKVQDSLGGPIPGATVMLVGEQDSILKSFAVTNKEGLFTLTNVKPDNYVFKVNFYGFNPYENPLLITEASTDSALGEIQLQPKMLDVVNVQGYYMPISINGDTIEYDARAFETGEHDNVENLLEQLPGVEVQEDGSIKVQGKDVDKVLVDGEEFFGNDPTLATKNLPANSVDKVQVYDKQSDMAEFTGIDDGDESTTINLELKEDHKKGVFGNVQAAYGGNENALDRYQVKGNVHYFKKKWQTSLIGLSNNVNETGFSINDYINFMGGIQNLMSGNGELTFDTNGSLPLDFGQNNGFLSTNATGINFNFKPNNNGRLYSSVFFNTFDKTFDKTIDRTTYFTDSSLFTKEQSIQESSTFNNRANINYKQEVDSTHFYTLSFEGYWTRSNFLNTGSIYNYDSSDSLRNSFITNQNMDNFQYNFTGSGDYRYKFNKKGRYTGGGVSYNQSQTDAYTRLNYMNSYYIPGLTSPLVDDIIQDQNELTTTTNLTTNWMYSEPIGNKNLLQFGVEHNRTMNRRNKEVSDVLNDDYTIFNNLFSGKGEYSTFTDRIELKHKYVSKNLKVTTSLRYDYLNLSGDSIFAAPQDYTYFLPMMRINWDINKASEFELRYSTSTTAPTLNQLQPIPDNSNPAETILGNLGLIPEYNHDINLHYNIFNEFSFTHFMSMIGMRYVQNNITYAQEIDSLFNRILTPENIGNEIQGNTYINFGSSIHRIKTKFSLTNSSNISNGQVFLNGQQDTYTSTYISSTFTIENIGKKVINAKTGITYNWSKNLYEENQAFNNSYQNWNYFADLTFKIKDKWEFNARANHFLYPDFEDADLLIVNASIARNFLKSRKLQVYIAAKDILNQNTGIDQYYFMNYYQQERTATLGRYFMFGIKYSFQKLGAN